MDPRPTLTDPLAGPTADLEALEADAFDSPQQEVEVYSRIHTGLAAALAGAATERTGPSGPGPGR